MVSCESWWKSNYDSTSDGNRQRGRRLEEGRIRDQQGIHEKPSGVHVLIS
jgi:hypothetical protein